ncbi:unnamed protein product [Withania somnifera]
MKATQIECGNTLASFQKWQSTVHNCNSLGVNRSLNQCKRRWESVLEQYNKVKPWESAYWRSFDVDRKKELELPEEFDFELFNAIGRYLSCLQGENGAGDETDPDTDPEAQQGQGNNAFLEIGPKRQRRRTKTKRYKMEERLNPWRRILNENRKYEQSKMGIKHEASIDANLEAPRHENSSLERMRDSSMEEKAELANLSVVGEVKAEQINDNPEEMMAATLRENAEMIATIFEGNSMDDKDYNPDLKNSEAGRVHLIRSQGDQLIDCLGKISYTLSKLCDEIHKK